MPIRALPKQAFSLVAAAAFSSGALTIALEMILMKVATRYMGSAADGTTIALTVYLLGLLAGSALVLKLKNKSRDSAGLLPLIGLLFLALAVFILGNVAGLDTASVFVDRCGLILPACVVLILVPACLAGTIFPLLVVFCSRFYFGSSQSFLENKSQLPSCNTQVILLYLLSNLGSALGAMAGAIWLLPRLGITHSFDAVATGYLVSAAFLIPLAMAAKNPKKALVIEPQLPQEQDLDLNLALELELELEDGAEEAIVSTSRPFFFVSVFAAALAGLLFECLAIRIMDLICGASFVSTACVVTAVLLAISLASRLSLLLPANKNTRLTLALALALGAAGLAATVLLLPHLTNIFQAIRHLAFSQMTETTRHSRWLAYLYPRLLLSLIFCLPGAIGISLVFPVAIKSASRSSDMLRLYIAAGLGTAMAPLIFILGIGKTLPHMPFSAELILRLLVVLLTALAIVALRDRAFFGKKAGEAIFSKACCFSSITAAAAVLLLSSPVDVHKIDLGLSFVPPTFSVREVEEDARTRAVLFFKEGRTATISVLANGEDNTASLKSDGKIEGTVPIDSKAPSLASDLTTQTMLALLPCVCQTPAAKIHSCFLIGYGTGTTAATIVKALPEVRLKVAEIEPVVVRAGLCFKENASLLAAKPVTTGDARHILQTHSDLYDLIVSQPSEPWVQGSTNLYSDQFYQLVKKRLSQNGMFCQWLQLYGMDANGLASALITIQATFPNCLVYHPPAAGEIIVLAFNGHDTYSPTTLAANISDLKLRKLLAGQNIDDVEDVARHVIAAGTLSQSVHEWQREEANVRKITDDNLALEYASVPEIENAAACIQGNLSRLSKTAKTGQPDASTTAAESNTMLLDKASLQLDKGDTKEAAATIAKIINADPDNTRALNMQALLALQECKVDQSEKLLKKSVELNPGEAAVHLLQSLVMLYRGNSAQAIKEADLAHRLDKEDYRPYLLAAAAFHLGGDNDEALAKIKKARQICRDGVILKQVDGLAGEFSRPLPSSESITYSGTLASRLTTFLRGISSSSYTRCNYVF